MNQRGPSLDDLIQAHRDGVQLTSDQRGRGRMRVLSRIAAGVAASTVAGTAGGAAGGVTAGHFSWALLAKVGIGLVVATGAGVAYRATRSPHLETAALTRPAVVATTDEKRGSDRGNAVVDESAPSEDHGTREPTLPAAGVHGANRGVASNKPALRASSASPSLLAGDVQLMHDVESALAAGQPERALLLLDARRASHVSGPLDEERAAARIVTLCKLGRGDEARAEAGRFLRDWPRSPLVERVRSTCPKTSEPTPAPK
jgi:hypothetical protein